MVIVDEQGFIYEDKSDELLHVNIDGAVKQITPDKVARIESVQSAEEAARALNVSVEELSQVIPDTDTGLGVATAMEANSNMDGANAVRTYINATFGAPVVETPQTANPTRTAEEIADAKPTSADVAAPVEQTVRLSDEVDENGKQFVLNSNGEIAFGEITDETGLTPAPILLSEGMITNPATNEVTWTKRVMNLCKKTLIGHFG